MIRDKASRADQAATSSHGHRETACERECPTAYPQYRTEKACPRPRIGPWGVIQTAMEAVKAVAGKHHKGLDFPLAAHYAFECPITYVIAR